MDWLKKGDKIRMTRNHGTLSVGDVVTIEKVDKSDKHRPYYAGGFWPLNGEFEPIREFHIGSRIKLVKDRDYAKAGMTGTIVTDMQGGGWGVKFDDKFAGGHNLGGKCEHGYGHWIAQEAMELLEDEAKPKFYVGQRVRIRSWESMKKEFGADGSYINIYPYFTKDMKHLCGRIATIESIDRTAVELKDWNNDSGDIFWSYSTDMLEPAGTFEVGQIYRSNCDDAEKGNIVKITEVSGQFIKYDTVRGKGLGTLFLDGCPFADGLVLLTGSEIGKAIRKWDADHAKKPEPEYNEVKRPAKVGEKIKVMNAHMNQTYKNGDIMTVTIKDFPGAWCRPDSCGSSAYLSDSEYVVLEPKSGVKEVKRQAKPGEYIKLTEAPYSFNHVGDILKMGADGRHILGGNHPCLGDGCDNSFAYCYPSDEYVVLEGYKPEQKGKHSYTTDEVAKAKKLCGEMMAELLESGKIGIRFQDKDNDPPYDDGRTYVYATKPGYVTTEEYAICSDHDEYNVWIGRCVALCKALHKPIPAFIMGH